MSKQAPAEEEECPADNASPPAAGTSEDSVLISRKRHRELEEESGRAKRLTDTVDSVAEEYICPITMELPVDPVTAEDGRVYERSAIEKHIQTQTDLMSPMTNEPMGARLLPAVQVRNMIKSFVTSGAITGSKADKWKGKIADDELVEKTRKKAEEGDVDSMYALGRWYHQGKKGRQRDDVQSHQWLKKGSDLRDTRCMTGAGCQLCGGNGVEANVSHGISLVSVAAEAGSDAAALYLGLWYKEGRLGLPKESKQARYWLKKVADGNCIVLHDGSSKRREQAIQLLQELEAEV